MGILQLITALFTGFFLGLSKFFTLQLKLGAKIIIGGGLILLLLTMGFSIGSEKEIIYKLEILGLQALLLAFGSILGSVSLLLLLKDKTKLSFRGFKSKKTPVEQGNKFFTLLLFCSLFSGIILGFYRGDFLESKLVDQIIYYALLLLVFGVGIDLGLNRKILLSWKQLGWQILLIPLLICIGSIGGAYLVGLILKMPANHSLAVGAGFGWYSLSAVIINRMHSIELGTIAFLANVLREILAILMIPFVVKYLGKISAIGPGGATTMDVTLPVIKKYGGDELVLPAFFSGIILSLLVPILVPLLLSLP